MKIIDFERKGNVVRFYLGDDDCEDYHGDDWNDKPYDCNAGEVYPEYVKGYRDILFPFSYTVFEPKDGAWDGARWCKDDMKARKVPCIVALEDPTDEYEYQTDRFDDASQDVRAIKYYFGDKMAPGVSVVHDPEHAYLSSGGEK